MRVWLWTIFALLLLIALLGCGIAAVWTAHLSVAARLGLTTIPLTVAVAIAVTGAVKAEEADAKREGR